MSRSYSTFREMQPFTDGRKKATYSVMVPSDLAYHPVIVDAEGRKNPINRYTSGMNGQTYVIKTEKIVEKIVEHSTVPAPASSFWHTHVGSTYHHPEIVEYSHLDSPFDLPEEVKEFLTKVVTEPGHGPTRPVALPLSSAWHSDPNRIVQESTGKYSDERDFRGDDRRDLNGSPNWDRHNEPYLNNEGANTHPMIRNNRDVYDFYKRSRGNEGANARNHPLSKPTNDIGTAMEFLKESSKPSYGNGKEKEFNANAYTEAGPPTKTVPLGSTRWPNRSNMSGPEDYESIKPSYGNTKEKEFNPSAHAEASRPTKRVPLGPTRWPNGSNMLRPETKMESKDYESVKPSYDNAKEKEFNASTNNEANRPTKTVPLGPTRWPNGSNMYGPETKMESKDYESEKEEEEEEESRNPCYGKRDELKMVNNGGGAKPLENKDGYEKPKGNASALQFGQTHFPGSTMQKKEQNTYPEKIDSREASRRYGKPSSRPLEKEEYRGTINSTEAMKKYNGALVPQM